MDLKKTSEILCKICGHPSSSWEKGWILNKYLIQCYCCGFCGFIQTEEPFWLDESYSDAIARNDIGLVRRNITMSRLTRAVVLSFFNCNARFIDYGGGYGLLVRLMRDNGFNYFLNDKYAPNLFARGFEAEKNDKEKFELLTAFEVFEHLSDPLEEIKEMLNYSTSILFTTRLVTTPPPSLDSWWYYSLESGQHVAFYTIKSLELIAEKLNLYLFSDHHSFHLLTDRKLSQIAFKLFSLYPVARLLNLILRGKQTNHTFLPSDYFELTGKRLT